MAPMPFGLASPVIGAAWEENFKLRPGIFKTRDCQSIAGFSLYRTKTEREKRKNENEEN
jgi:hypothetical protein